MGLHDEQKRGIADIKENLVGNLTINDALILIAVCAAKEQAAADESPIDKASNIADLAQNNTIFSGIDDSIEPSINKFMNIIGTTTDLVKLLDMAASVLDPQFKETAFGWAAEIIMPDGVLTEERKSILDKYALLLDIDRNDVQKILVKISNQQ